MTGDFNESIKTRLIVAVSLGVMLVAFNAVYFAVTGFAAEGKGDDRYVHNFPATAFEYAKMVESELGVPPRIDLGEGVEVLTYVDGVPTKGTIPREDCDNPTQLFEGDCVSGSVLHRYEGKSAGGEPLPHVVWVSFGRHAPGGHHLGSVQMIGYNVETGSTAFFESGDKADETIAQWARIDPETQRLVGVMPWID